jgi:SAF domain
MRSPARQSTDPSTLTPAPVDRRFGTATLGHPDPPPLPPPGMEPPGDAPGRRPGLDRLIMPAVALLVVGAFLLGRWLADRGEVAVWQVTRPIPAGKVVTEADLRQGAVAKAISEGALPATDDPDGHVARVPIPAGALLTPDVLTRGPALPGQGEALVGIALAPGAAPAEGLATGDLVRVIQLSATAEEIRQRGGGRLVLAAAPVWATRAGKDGTTVVTLLVAVEDADHVAGLSARGAVALERITAPS